MNEKIFRQLQEYVRNKSVDMLKNVNPQKLICELDITDIELKELVEALYEKGLLSYKYNIFCPSCGINHTIYENEFKNGEKECDDCGDVINLQYILGQASLLYVLDKFEIIAFGEQIDFKAESLKNLIEISNVKNVRAINNELITKEEKMEIFIGSSTEAEGEIDEIAIELERNGFKALPWNAKRQNLFTATNSTLENLINIAERVHAAIFIFNSDDETWYSSKNIKVTTTRDNVLFEYGLFMGKKGKNKVAFICKNKPKLATDLSGITYIDADQGLYNMKADLQDWLKTL